MCHSPSSHVRTPERSAHGAGVVLAGTSSPSPVAGQHRSIGWGTRGASSRVLISFLYATAPIQAPVTCGNGRAPQAGIMLQL